MSGLSDRPLIAKGDQIATQMSIPRGSNFEEAPVERIWKADWKLVGAKLLVDIHETTRHGTPVEKDEPTDQVRKSWSNNFRALWTETRTEHIERTRSADPEK